MTESRRQVGHMFCECNEKIKTSAPLYIALYWIGEVMTFPIPSCLSIPINAHPGEKIHVVTRYNA